MLSLDSIDRTKYMNIKDRFKYENILWKNIKKSLSSFRNKWDERNTLRMPTLCIM